MHKPFILFRAWRRLPLRPLWLLMFLLISMGFLTAFALPYGLPENDAFIPYQAVRLHVLANSDTKEDQTIKLQVRDAVNALLSEPLKNVSGREQALQCVREMQPDIQRVSNGSLEKAGAGYRAQVTIERDYFPERTYGGTVYPPGMYDAVRVKLGEAKGANWWCVVFPPLCYVDIRQAEWQEDELRAFLESEDADVEVKSAIAELLDKWFGGAKQ